MKNYSLIGFLLLGTIVLSACDVNVSNLSDEDLTRLSEKAIVCPDAYIRFGTSCCLDQNSNGICDKDESNIPTSDKPSIIEPKPATTTPPKPSVQKPVIPQEPTPTVVNSIPTPSVADTEPTIPNEPKTEQKPSPIGLENYPDFFIEGNTFNGEIITSDKASAEEIIGATDISVSLQYANGGSQLVDIGATKLASEVSDINNKDAILIGTICNNAAIWELMGSPSIQCEEGSDTRVGKAGVGTLDIYYTNSHIQVVVSGYGKSDIRNAAQVLANYQDYENELKGSSVTVRRTNNGFIVE